MSHADTPDAVTPDRVVTRFLPAIPCAPCEGRGWMWTADRKAKVGCAYCGRLISGMTVRDEHGRILRDPTTGLARVEARFWGLGLRRLTASGPWASDPHCAGTGQIRAPGDYASEPCGACRYLVQQGRRAVWRSIGQRPEADLISDPHPPVDLLRGVTCSLGPTCRGHARNGRGRDFLSTGDDSETWAARLDRMHAA